jgi:hypothetical protein
MGAVMQNNANHCRVYQVRERVLAAHDPAASASSTTAAVARDGCGIWNHFDFVCTDAWRACLLPSSPRAPARLAAVAPTQTRDIDNLQGG